MFQKKELYYVRCRSVGSVFLVITSCQKKLTFSRTNKFQMLASVHAVKVQTPTME
jgi:hypothetical protein